MAKGICSVDGCGRLHYARSWCEPHYHRWKKRGEVFEDEPIEPRQKRGGSCDIPTCDRPVYGRRLCLQHWRRHNKHGDAQADIPFRQNSDGSCSIDGCARPHEGLGWCMHHYGPYRLYKLTPDAYEALLASQGGGCAICGTKPTEEARLHVDHDHHCCPARKRSCGRCVRGMLCDSCNNGLGRFRDDPALLRAAIQYLGQLI